MNFKEFRDAHLQCPYCGVNNFKFWTHLADGSALEYTCNTCWGSDFGWQFRFKTINNKVDDSAPLDGFRIWNGIYEAWFYVDEGPYFNSEETNPSNFNVLIVNQGPVADNPVGPRLKKKCFIAKSQLNNLLNKKFIFDWIDKQVK